MLKLPLMLKHYKMPWPADASENGQHAVEAHMVGRIPWLVQSEQWTHRLAALSLLKASDPPFSETPPLLCRALLALGALHHHCALWDVLDPCLLTKVCVMSCSVSCSCCWPKEMQEMARSRAKFSGTCWTPA